MPGKRLCHHWLAGNCTKGENCSSLHEIIESLLPDCSKEEKFGQCNKAVCQFKHSKPKLLTTEKEKRICHHWLAGKCRAGESCKYLHEKAATTVASAAPTAACNYYLQGKCTKGAKCTFLHETDSGTTPKCHAEAKAGLCNNIDCPYTHDKTPGETRHRAATAGKTKVCTFFQSGKCTKGDKCDFRHEMNPPCKIEKQYGECTNKKCTYTHSNRKSKSAIKKSDVSEVCTFHLSKRCLHGDKCYMFHTDLPYQWQYEDATNGDWISFDTAPNQTIEEAFCKPVEQAVKINNSAGKEFQILFEDLKYTTNQNDSGSIRRRTTPSWGSSYKTRPFATEWLWYWFDESNTWRQYQEPQDIEEKYQDNQDSEYKMMVDTTKFNYILRFEEMKQENLQHGTKRQMIRRPRLYVKREAAAATAAGSGRPRDVPDSWQITDQSKAAELVELEPSSEEYQIAKRRFDETMSGTPIKWIKRIQNAEQYFEFVMMKRKMLRNKGVTYSESETASDQLTSELNEKLLFHGTRQDLIEPIYSMRGFDWRLAGMSVGTLYGKGNYFARDASYSKSYTNSNTLFLVRVLAGEYARGQKDMPRPPPKDPSQPYGAIYDSCVDNTANPSIIVAFEFGQAYPAYLIQY